MVKFNIDYLKSWNCIFKLLQLVFGAACIGIICSNLNVIHSRDLEFLLLVFTSSFFIGTIIIFISFLVSPFTASILPKTIHERYYNYLAGLFICVTSVTLVRRIHSTDDVVLNYEAKLTASICGILNALSYAFSAISAWLTKWDKDETQDNYFIFILRPHVHEHEMDVYH